MLFGWLQKLYLVSVVFALPWLWIALVFRNWLQTYAAIKEVSPNHLVSQTALKACNCWSSEVLMAQKETTFKDNF